MDSGRENGENIRRHSLDGLNASTIKQKNPPDPRSPPLPLSPLPTLRQLSLRPSPPVSASLKASHRKFTTEFKSCSCTPSDCAATLLNATTLWPTFPGAVRGAHFLRKIATSSSWWSKAILLLASRSVLSLSVIARLTPFFGFARLLRPGATVAADKDGHSEAVASPSIISPGREANPSSKSCPALLSYPLRFVSTFFHPSSVSPWRGGGPAAEADIEVGGCAGSVSTSACSECMRFGFFV